MANVCRRTLSLTITVFGHLSRFHISTHQAACTGLLPAFQVRTVAKRGLSGMQVYMARWGFTKVAVKRLVVRQGSEPRRLEAEQDILKEIAVMSSCSHRNLVHFYSACMDPEQVCARAECLLGKITSVI